MADPLAVLGILLTCAAIIMSFYKKKNFMGMSFIVILLVILYLSGYL